MAVRVFVLLFMILCCFPFSSIADDTTCLLKSDFLDGMNSVLVSERFVFLDAFKKLCQVFETDKWLNLTDVPVCFGSNDEFATVVVPFEGFFGGLKLVHQDGQITCDLPGDGAKWGCSPNHPIFGKTPLNVIITTENRRNVIFPRPNSLKKQNSLWYSMPDTNPESTTLIFTDLSHPQYIAAGGQLQIGFGDVLTSGRNIKGKVCVKVQGWFVH